MIKSQPNNFNISQNDDSGFYNSNYRLMYSDKTLYVSNHLKNTTDIYTNESSSATWSSSVKYRDYEIGIDSNGLYIKGNDLSHNIKGETSDYYIDGDNIVYKVNNKQLTIFNLKTQNTNTLNTVYEIHWFAASENSVFTANHNNREDFVVESFDINTLEKTNSFSGNIFNSTIFLLCNNEVYIVTPPYSTISIYRVDFEAQQLEYLHTHNYVNSIVSNDKYIIFSAEKYSTLELVTRTVEDEDNGLWAYDIANKTLTKISEECVFEDLIATENYVYGLTETYLLPRGFFNIPTGYNLTEIKID